MALTLAGRVYKAVLLTITIVVLVSAIVFTTLVTINQKQPRLMRIEAGSPDTLWMPASSSFNK